RVPCDAYPLTLGEIGGLPDPFETGQSGKRQVRDLEDDHAGAVAAQREHLAAHLGDKGIPLFVQGHPRWRGNMFRESAAGQDHDLPLAAHSWSWRTKTRARRVRPSQAMNRPGTTSTAQPGNARIVSTPVSSSGPK